MRLMGATVFLEDLRCDGSAHDGCQRNCLIFWKEAWLKSVNEQSATDPLVGSLPSDDYARSRDLPTRKGDLYFCQSTELAGATRPLSRWNILHFATDILYGELSLGRFFRIVARMATNRIRYLGGLPAPGNLVGQRRGRPGVPGARKGDLDLRPGEWVEVKLADEVKATLDANGKNCGLSFEPEMLEYCGRRFEVDFPVRKIILEETGQMIGLTAHGCSERRNLPRVVYEELSAQQPLLLARNLAAAHRIAVGSCSDQAEKCGHPEKPSSAFDISEFLHTILSIFSVSQLYNYIAGDYM